MTKANSNTQLIKSAAGNGNISDDALIAINNVTDLGKVLQNAIGVSIDDVDANEVVLVFLLADDSGSIRMAGNSKTVCDGHNLVIQSLQATKQKNGILAMTMYLNETVPLFPWSPIDQAVLMDNTNYNANGGTPLYDKTVEMLALIAAKTEEFETMSGVPARSISLIVTDGADCGSHKQTPKTVAAVVKSMLKQEKHIIAAMGIDDGSTDFKQIFSEMGIQDQWILVPGNSQTEIRKAFQMFSQSAVRASQSGGNFSQTAAGGFGSTTP
jgi:hypothetical protein